jgi:hypothetical protein
MLLNILSNISTSIGWAFLMFFGITKNTIDWSEAIGGNAYYIAFGLMILGILLKLFYYFLSGKKKEARNFVLLIVIVGGVFTILYYITT